MTLDPISWLVGFNFGVLVILASLEVMRKKNGDGGEY